MYKGSHGHQGHRVSLIPALPFQTKGLCVNPKDAQEPASSIDATLWESIMIVHATSNEGSILYNTQPRVRSTAT
jgi:hypothetical protein